MPRVSVKRAEALRAVADGRVQFGAPYPRMARKQGFTLHEFLIDGYEVYGAAHGTYRALVEAGLIRERTEDVEMHTVPAEVRRTHSVAGPGEEYELPEREVPVDPGWRVAVELTAAGRTLLDSVA